MRTISRCRATSPLDHGLARCAIGLLLALSAGRTPCPGQTRTWDGLHDTTTIRVTVVYFVPRDRVPLPDWRERLEYYRRRLEQFHRREFQEQSRLDVRIVEQPLISRRSTEELRRGDANAIFYRTLEEADQATGVRQQQGDAFPILLVLSDINWRPLDDFYRLKPDGGQLVFEGNYQNQEHFPGAASGGARAAYLADPGIGWGLVSGDGWRTPYRGSDCVVYHEGLGHTVGLPHPEQGNGSVMSLGQYQGWLSESWLDADQKQRLGWRNSEQFQPDAQLELFSAFRALPEPRVPQPEQAVRLKLDWPPGARPVSLRIRLQTSLSGPWIDIASPAADGPLAEVALGSFDRPTPVSYRVDAKLDNGAAAELWGYFQVREKPTEPPRPFRWPPDLAADEVEAPHFSSNEIDLLARLDVAAAWKTGDWKLADGVLLSPKQYGARIELPYEPPPEYRLTLIVEPLDEPHGLILGQRSGQRRFVTLFHYKPAEQGLFAIENIDGRNVGNETTFQGDAFRRGRLSQVVTTVRREGVTMMVDGKTIVDWRGSPDRLSLSDYWKTPNDQALFLGAYDCRYRFHRITVEALSAEAENERP